MPTPVIMTVDDEPQVLNAIERDLRQKYGRDYRILKAPSGESALSALEELKRRSTPVALFIVDQRMPHMSGTEFLSKAIPLFPQARKMLLTAYADTQAAIASINEIGLDYYLMKPWDPPALHLYPVIDDLLSDWIENVPLPYEGIRVAGTLWSATSHNIKDFLGRNRIPYQWLDIEKDSEARQMVESIEADPIRLPVVFFPDGSTLVQPDFRTLAAKAGLQTEASQPFYDLIIIGAGPAGLGAAVYGASEGFHTALIEREATGGQAGTSSRIENYLGFPSGVSGADLARRATTQARRFGVEILTAQNVVKVRVEDPYRIAVLEDGTELTCRAMVVACGVKVRRLKAPGIEELTGAGVYYGAALTEAAHYRDGQIFVVGGANSAGQAAMFFSRYARQVTMLVRSRTLEAGMSKYLVDQIQDTPNIHVMYETELVEACGENRLQAVHVSSRNSAEIQELPADAVFIFIGAVAQTDFIADVIQTNRAGFILTGADLIKDGKRPEGWKLKRDPYPLETSVPGIFAAGDVRQGAIRRVASAVGEGAVVVNLIHQYLKTV